MKMYRGLLCVALTLMSALHCSCQSSDERVLANEPSYPELDHSKIPMASLNGLLDTLEHDSRQLGGSNPEDYETADSLAARLGYPHLNGEAKRGWGKMNAAWGKRAGSRNSGWTKFGAAWGKREPGWNNLKGLWGKRADKWDKLASAWGKRQEISRSY
ncbi:prothoracicostatic peptides [Anopheles stephensi]|uniref:prothoracicostatic peptides n=1 Tax=Anopheles stephensi TaxID=30069 RepID=UPI001658C0CF|nr:prothoracicostatic peptides [Anopheles stephensi]XP_035899405.1 prothoracicostatic peptides [Anopheles stephensi]XP_035899412.1 prothoracicostatic peptides [Anopheles stephensi]XP_035899421.1 prothoracicostatic peptides [Anopheles stephensi]